MNENIAERLRYCTTLPSAPGVAMRIIDLANRPDSSMVQICDCVSMDPALSAKFLKVARSPLYLTRRTATNVRQAISLLGTHASIMIALSFSLLNSMKAADSPSKIDRTQFWRRSMISALACRALGEKMGLKKLDDLFLAGLLQDIGVLAFDAMMPDEYKLVNRVSLSHEELVQAERNAFGTGHDEVGYWLLKRWRLPEYLAQASLASHSMTLVKEAMSKMTACIAVSGSIADHFLHPYDSEITARAYQYAADYLDMNSENLAGILDIVAARLPAAEELFDIDLIGESEVNAVMAEARDLQLLRQLSKSQEIERLSQRDALTGAHNRGFLESVLQREFELASRHGWPLSVAMIDLDHFKNVNDTHGHPVGDSVLVSVVRRVQNQLRPDDIFARYGGEEFIVILPGTPLVSTMHIVQRIKDSVGSIEHIHDKGEPFRVTVSAGVAAHMDGDVQFKRPEEIIKAVDDALYKAKHGGRNRVEAWEGHIPLP